MMEADPAFVLQRDPRVRGAVFFALEVLAIGAVYFALAKSGLLLASINPSATPIWPPTGFALAAVLLRGPRIWPAIFAGAFIANATTAGTLVTAASIGIGNTLEAVVGALLINRWSDGAATFIDSGRRRSLCVHQLSADRHQRQRRRRHAPSGELRPAGECRRDLADLVARRSRWRAGGDAGTRVVGDGTAIGHMGTGRRAGHHACAACRCPALRSIDQRGFSRPR